MNVRIYWLVIIFFFGILSCSNSKDKIEQQNKEIVMNTFDAVSSGDFEELNNYFADNYVRHCQATPGLIIESLDDFKEFLKADRISIPDQKLNVKMLVAEDNLVAFWATYSGTQTGNMGPFPPSNKYAELDFSGVHKLEKGKLIESWITWDNVSILSQLGHFPPNSVNLEE